jgi:hypothetical protein
MIITEDGSIQYSFTGSKPTEDYVLGLNRISIVGTTPSPDKTSLKISAPNNDLDIYDFDGNSLEHILEFLENQEDQKLFYALIQLAESMIKTSENIKPKYIKILNERYWDLF